MSETGLALVADIGGTNVRFALVQPGHTGLKHEQNLRCADFSGPVEAVRHYLSLVGASRVSVAAFDVATPVTGDLIQLTNGPWSFSIAETRDALHLAQLHVINDFTALALAVPLLESNELRQIGGGTSVPGKAIGVLGAGTGLGVSGLLWNGQHWLPLEGEGGHVSFSPMNEREDAILQVLRRRCGAHVSAERVLSGMGLTNIHAALCELDGDGELSLAPEQITAQARRGDVKCCETIAVFCGALGTVAGNLALTLGARSGVYVGGGIVSRLGDLFDSALFRERFENKGRYRDYLAAIPIWLITVETPALRGLAALLVQATSHKARPG